MKDWKRGRLDHPQPTGRELDPERVESKLGWLRAYRQPIERWQRALEVVELVESTVRKEGYHAGSAEALLRKLFPADPPRAMVFLDCVVDGIFVMKLEGKSHRAHRARRLDRKLPRD